MTQAQANLTTAERYIALFNGPKTPLADFRALLALEVVYREMPNVLWREGSVRNRGEMHAGVEQGRKLLSSQRYTIFNAIAQGDQVALGVVWTGTLAVGFGALKQTPN
ncbi:MAG: nuclear transport factor 2 family protein [Caldilineaceae bacterium]|nr:nuclear transport factor 2 family protein [Caldilineaceae bacterium]